MNRAEFMRRLEELLKEVAPAEREEAIQYYNDYFDDAGEENESGVIASLGTPEELARSIKAGLSDGGSGGEFTESGFSGYTQMSRDEIIRQEDVNTSGQSQKNGNPHGSFHGGVYGTKRGDGRNEYHTAQPGDNYYEGAYYKRPEGDGIYGGRKDTRHYDNPYEQSGTQNTGYGQDGSQGTSYGNAGASGSGTTRASAVKEPMSGGMIALLVILAIFTSPVWLGLLGALFGVVVGILSTLFALFLSFMVLGIVLVAVAIALLVVGILLLFSAPLAGLCVIGSGLALFGIGLVCIWVMVAMAGTAIPACVRGIISLCQKIFHRGGARA